jgi:hypothetical protein
MEAIACFGDGADGGLLERRADQVAIGGHLTDRPFDVPASEPIQAAVAERGHISLDRGPPDAGDLGGVLPREAAVQQPENEHLFPDPRVGMGRPLLVDDGLLLRGQLDAKPCHEKPPGIPP